MKNKRILLFKEMLSAVGFPSTDALIHCFSSGFPLVGAFPETGVFPAAKKKALMDIKDIWKMAPEIRKNIFPNTNGSSAAALDQQLYDVTLDEVANGVACWTGARK